MGRVRSGYTTENVAEERMRYHAKTKRYSLTEAGKLYVEQKILK